jgi:hypothetical protein
VPGRVAVIGTFYGRHENSFPLLHRLYVDATRRPDEAWLLCETDEDAQALDAAFDDLYDLEALDGWPDGLHVEVVETPRTGGGYAVIPYAHKINHALDRVTADYVVYLDNGSMPAPEKIAAMAASLDANPGWGAVYCAQKRTGYNETVIPADRVVEDGFCVLNYTQVMHRVTEDRWPLDMKYANPDLADGHFWRSLHATLGPFHPCPDGRVLDEHHIPDVKAAGI